MQIQLHPELSLYTRIGGDAAIRQLVDRFYELMDELPEAYAARKIHPADLTESGNKLFDFLSGWLTPCCGGGIYPTPSDRRNATNGCCACGWHWRKRWRMNPCGRTCTHSLPSWANTCATTAAIRMPAGKRMRTLVDDYSE